MIHLLHLRALRGELGLVELMLLLASEHLDSIREPDQPFLRLVAITRSSSQLVLTYSTRMELGLAMSLRVQVQRDRIRRVGDVKAAPTIASRFLGELGSDAPRAVQGPRWLESYLAGP